MALESFGLTNASRFWGWGSEKGPQLVPATLRKAADAYERALREDLTECD